MTSHVPIGIKTSPQAVDWATLDAMWARIGTHDVFESVWMNDHLTDISFDRHGLSLDRSVLPCGHYTLGRAPYKYYAGYLLVNYLRKHL